MVNNRFVSVIVLTVHSLICKMRVQQELWHIFDYIKWSQINCVLWAMIGKKHYQNNHIA